VVAAERVDKHMYAINSLMHFRTNTLNNLTEVVLIITKSINANARSLS